MKRSSTLTGASGVYFVASMLAFRNLHAAVTVGNAPYVDIIASSPDGSSSVAIQVKTTEYALRLRGRGKNRVPHHYEFPAGDKVALANEPGLFVAFVDLKRMEELPDAYILASTSVYEWFAPKGELKWRRFHPLIEEVETYRNNWEILESFLHRDRRF